MFGRGATIREQNELASALEQKLKTAKKFCKQPRKERFRLCRNLTNGIRKTQNKRCSRNLTRESVSRNLVLAGNNT